MHTQQARHSTIFERYLICLVLLCIAVAGTVACTVGNEMLTSESDTSSIHQLHTAAFSAIDSIFVIHFHPAIQCSCCINVGEFSQEALRTHYSGLCEEGKLSHSEYNIDDDSYIETGYEVSDAALAFEAFTERGHGFKLITSVWDHCMDKDRFVVTFREEMDAFVLEVAAADSLSKSPEGEDELPVNQGTSARKRLIRDED